MNTKLLDQHGPKTYALVFDKGDELIDGLTQFARQHNLDTASFTGSTMLVAGGGLCLGVSKAALTAAGAGVGDEVQLSIAPASD